MLNCFSTVFLPSVAIVLALFLFDNKLEISEAIALASLPGTRTPFTFDLIKSSGPPEAVAMTGTTYAIASKRTIPKSSLIEGKTNKSKIG